MSRQSAVAGSLTKPGTVRAGGKRETTGWRLKVASPRAPSDSMTWGRPAVSAPAETGDNASRSG